MRRELPVVGAAMACVVAGIALAASGRRRLAAAAFGLAVLLVAFAVVRGLRERGGETTALERAAPWNETATQSGTPQPTLDRPVDPLATAPTEDPASGNATPHV
jgi:uncharacterized membrane protein YfcA